MPLVAAHVQRPHRARWRRYRFRQVVVFLEAGLCLCAAGAFFYAFYHYTIDSPSYRVRNIVVPGAKEVQPEDVMRASGVNTEKNLLFIDREAVAARVEQLPYVESAQVDRELPNTLIITIKERTAVATLVAGSHCFLIDRTGVVLKKTELAAEPVGPLITNVPDLGVPSVGDHLNQPALQEALKVWEAYTAAPISREVTLSEISAEGPLNLRMYWNEVPYEVRWGRSDYTAQAERLSVLWKEKGGQLPCQEYLDLRFDEDLVCR